MFCWYILDSFHWFTSPNNSMFSLRFTVNSGRNREVMADTGDGDDDEEASAHGDVEFMG